MKIKATERQFLKGEVSKAKLLNSGYETMQLRPWECCVGGRVARSPWPPVGLVGEGAWGGQRYNAMESVRHNAMKFTLQSFYFLQGN